MKRVPSIDAPHPGINYSKIPIGGGVAGLLAALGVIYIGLVGVPLTRWFLAASLVAGAGMALVRRYTGRGKL